MSIRYGYACINMELSYPKQFSKPKGTKPIMMSRGMIKKTFEQKGLAYASELALQNVRDFIPILKWNLQNDITFFRVSSNIFPWASEYQLEQLPDYEEIQKVCRITGDFIKKNNIRITSHPGPYNKLASSDERVILNTMRDLEIHGEFFDLLELPRTPESKINIHIGGAYGNKTKTLDLFCKNYDKLPETVKSRLTIENDDKKSLFSSKELVAGLYSKIAIPIVFDYHHHAISCPEIPEKEALEEAISTWGNIRPVVHYSESRSKEKNDPRIKDSAHSDYVVNKINDYGFDLDIMIEAKMKELALTKYKLLHLT